MKLRLPEGPFKAYLFDCDGTIADSMPLHYLAWKKALAEWSCAFPEDVFYAWGGMPAAEIVATLARQQCLTIPAEEVAHRKELLYYELLPELQAVPEVLEQIQLNWNRNGIRIPMAVVSGSTRDSVTKSLELLGLLDKFSTLVCAGDYTRSKPDPEPFLVAAARLNVAPADCLVFEDTDMGVQAATAAGMASVRILQPWERAKAVTS
jgi:HAD superfamily hydrolase (TIGR01509 family)